MSASLTINQIILLLDIYRGEGTQGEIGTAVQDSRKLEKLGFIKIDVTDYDGKHKSVVTKDITELGVELVQDIKTWINEGGLEKFKH
jgi:DNA-binding PadR family transcriptional regulator